AGDNPDAKVQGKHPPPKARMMVPSDIAGAQPQRLRDDQEQREPDRQHRPENMEQRRDRELQTRQNDDVISRAGHYHTALYGQPAPLSAKIQFAQSLEALIRRYIYPAKIDAPTRRAFNIL